MYFINKDEKLTPVKIGEIINSFKINELPKLNKYYNYYLGKQEIQTKTVNDPTKPNNKITTNFCNSIVSTYSGYLTGIDITYTSDEDITAIQDILNYNDVSNEDAEMLKNALIFGTAFEVMWIDDDGKQRFRVLDSRECIPIYYNDLEETLCAVIRFYATNNLSLLDNDYYVDVYTEKEIVSYKSDNSFASFQTIDFVPCFYQQVPINVFALNKERESIFAQVLSLQDSYNTLLSAEVDDFSAFVDAYMVLQGIDNIDEESLSLMRTNRVLVLPEGGSANFLNKNISDTQISNMLENIENKIHEISCAPDFSSDAFGTSSGIAMRFKLLGFENRAGSIEKAMIKALQRRIELICSILSLTNGESLWRDIQIIFTRNLPIDYADLTSTLNSLRGLVSDKTLLAQIPFITDIDAEIELVAEQKASNASLYNFSSVGTDEEVDE